MPETIGQKTHGGLTRNVCEISRGEVGTDEIGHCKTNNNIKREG